MKIEYSKQQILELARKDRSRLSHRQRNVVDAHPKIKEKVSREREKAKVKAKTQQSQTLSPRYARQKELASKQGKTVNELRIERARARGLSKSQAVGKPKRGEVPASQLRKIPDQRPFKESIAAIRHGAGVKDAARDSGIGEAALKKYIQDKNIVLGKRYADSGKFYKRNVRRNGEIIHFKDEPILIPVNEVVYDPRIRVWNSTVDGSELRLDSDQSSIYGAYLNAVRKALQHDTDEPLKVWEGAHVVDVNGRVHTLSADLKKIKKANSGEGTFSNPNPYIFE